MQLHATEIEKKECSERQSLFVIGYPKSGNTWLARLCADVLDSPIIASNSPIDLIDNERKCNGGFVIYKQHYSGKHKPANITSSSKVVYIVRDFRDILVSGFFFNHNFFSEDSFLLQNKPNFFCKLYFHHSLKKMMKRWTSHEVADFLNFIKGKKPTFDSWSNHVNYWIEFQNVCVVRYEDLLTNTLSVLKKIFDQVGLPYSENKLHDAIERQSFSQRKKEFEKTGDIVNAKFLRKGKAGDWKLFLDKDILELVKKEHGQTMKLLGYEI